MAASSVELPGAGCVTAAQVDGDRPPGVRPAGLRGWVHDVVLLARRRRRPAGRGRLPRRSGDRDHDVPRRSAGEAAARRGPGRRRQDRAGQGGRPGDRRGPGAAAVLRGARRGARAVRVELQEAAAPHPGVAGRRPDVVGDPRRHLHRRVPAHPAAADRDPARGADGAAHRRGRQDRRRGRGAAARGAVRLPGDDPRARHRRRRTPPASSCSPPTRAASCPRPLKRRCLYLHLDYPDAEREREIVTLAGARISTSGSPCSWSRRSRGCASWSSRRRRRSRSPSTGRAR